MAIFRDNPLSYICCIQFVLYMFPYMSLLIQIMLITETNFFLENMAACIKVTVNNIIDGNNILQKNALSFMCTISLDVVQLCETQKVRRLSQWDSIPG